MPRPTPQALQKLKPGMTLDELSRKIGVDSGYLSAIFNNHRAGSLQVIRRIAAGLDSSVDKVIRKIEEAAA